MSLSPAIVPTAHELTLIAALTEYAPTGHRIWLIVEPSGRRHLTLAINRAEVTKNHPGAAARAFTPAPVTKLLENWEVLGPSTIYLEPRKSGVIHADFERMQARP